MQKIAITIPYYGKLPIWFDLYLKSCEFNKEIDFLFFTDIPKPQTLPSNVVYHYICFKDLLELTEQKTGIKIQWKNPYKLCDLKSIYGVLFEEYLTDYNYWGHADIDVIQGNLMSFLHKPIIEGFEVISSRKGIIAGPFTIFKNCKKINELYKSIPDIEKLIQSENSEYIDEIKMFNLLQQNALKQHIRCFYDEMLIEDALNQMRQRPHWLLIWKKGNLIDLQLFQRRMYYHFIHTKSSSSFYVSKTADYNYDKFYITEKGIFVNPKLFFLFKEFINGYIFSYKYMTKRLVKRYFLGIKDF